MEQTEQTGVNKAKQGIEVKESVVRHYVDLRQAQRTPVVRFRKLLSDGDITQVLRCHEAALAAGDPLVTNPQNRQHKRKRCLFLHGKSVPLAGQLLGQAPRVLAKIIRAAVSAQEKGNWGREDGDKDLALDGVDVKRCSIRVVEMWEYEPGGGLVEDHHFDAGSIVTAVCLINDDFKGGEFRTLEANGERKEHDLEKGDVLCFVSHKYHSVAPVTSGRRQALVVELWEGGLSMWCR
mmetsp:Transcript_48092/g.108026  ORF Transcript_48092/g.108026 Transcript_48092/m.108026 type:complete len:236 (-) Transcript_48092:5-712(-)